MNKDHETDQYKTPHLYIFLAWLFVSLPLLWGVYMVIVRSLPLFK